MKFIAELILCKILKTKLIKTCITQLFSLFLKHYYEFVTHNAPQYSIYDYQFEAIIEFIENIGERYEVMDEKDLK